MSACPVCTYQNNFSAVALGACEMCGSPLGAGAGSVGGAAASGRGAAWPCSVCTFLNSSAASKCGMCDDPKSTYSEDKPSKPSSPAARPSLHSEKPGSPPSVPRVFVGPASATNNADDEEKELLPIPVGPASRQVSDASDASWGSADDFNHDKDAAGDADWGGVVDVDDALHEGTMGVPRHVIDACRTNVTNDVFEVNQLHRYTASVDFSLMDADQVIVRLGMDLQALGLSKEQSLAWYLQADKLMLVELIFSSSYFDAPNPPVIKVGLADSIRSEIEECRLSWTLRHRIKNTFLKQHIKDKKPRQYELDDARSLMEMTHQPFHTCATALEKAKGDIANACVLANKTASTHRPWGGAAVFWRTSSKGEETAAESLAAACSVSFQVAWRALELEPDPTAAALLLGNPDVRSQLEATVSKEKKKIVETKKSAQQAPNGDEAQLAKLLSSHNLLARMVTFVWESLIRINKTCIICNEKLAYEGLRPDVCSKTLCVMSYETFGLGFSLSQELKDNADVCDLLISLMISSINANRLLFVTPEGVQLKQQDGTVLSFLDAQGNLDPQQVLKVLQLLPSVDELVTMAANYEMRGYLDNLHPLLAPLVRWIITSNRAHIRKLLPEEEIKGMNTNHQFVLLSATPEKEAEFKLLRVKAELAKGRSLGSLWAFHGSATGNWHSILRTGLKNLSNTKYMTAGAAHGPGVYLGLTSATSLSYCGKVKGWGKSRFGSNVQVMALCEVVNQDQGLNKHSWGFVVPDDRIVNTRFLFVGESIGNVSAESLKPPKLDID